MNHPAQNPKGVVVSRAPSLLRLDAPVQELRVIDIQRDVFPAVITLPLHSDNLSRTSCKLSAARYRSDVRIGM